MDHQNKKSNTGNYKRFTDSEDRGERIIILVNDDGEEIRVVPCDDKEIDGVLYLLCELLDEETDEGVLFRYEVDEEGYELLIEIDGQELQRVCEEFDVELVDGDGAELNYLTLN